MVIVYTLKELAESVYKIAKDVRENNESYIKLYNRLQTLIPCIEKLGMCQDTFVVIFVNSVAETIKDAEELTKAYTSDSALFVVRHKKYHEQFEAINNRLSLHIIDVTMGLQLAQYVRLETLNNEVHGLKSQLLENVKPLQFEGLIISSSAIVKGKQLGKGTFGTVYLAKWSNTQQVVLKEFKDSAKVEDIRYELSIHSQLRHPNIISLMGVCQENDIYSIVLEYAENGSLFDTLSKRKASNDPFSWETRARILSEIANGLDYLHKRGVIHRDLKSLNILLDDYFRAKISDFGLSTTVNPMFAPMRGISSSNSDPRRIVSTEQWTAPELPTRYTFSSDVFAFGVIGYEVSTDEVPYQNMTNVLVNVRSGYRLPIPDSVPAEFKAIIEKSWQTSPDARPTSELLVMETLNCYAQMCRFKPEFIVPVELLPNKNGSNNKSRNGGNGSSSNGSKGATLPAAPTVPTSKSSSSSSATSSATSSSSTTPTLTTVAGAGAGAGAATTIEEQEMSAQVPELSSNTNSITESGTTFHLSTVSTNIPTLSNILGSSSIPTNGGVVEDEEEEETTKFDSGLDKKLDSKLNSNYYMEQLPKDLQLSGDTLAFQKKNLGVDKLSHYIATPSRQTPSTFTGTLTQNSPAQDNLHNSIMDSDRPIFRFDSENIPFTSQQDSTVSSASSSSSSCVSLTGFLAQPLVESSTAATTTTTTTTTTTATTTTTLSNSHSSSSFTPHSVKNPGSVSSPSFMSSSQSIATDLLDARTVADITAIAQDLKEHPNDERVLKALKKLSFHCALFANSLMSRYIAQQCLSLVLPTVENPVFQSTSLSIVYLLCSEPKIVQYLLKKDYPAVLRRILSQPTCSESVRTDINLILSKLGSAKRR